MKTQLLRQTKKSLQLNDMKQLCSQNLRVRNLNKADTGGMAGRCSLMASDECLKAQGCLSHLKVCSPTCWVVDACSLLEMRPLLGWPGILLTAWGLGSPGEHPGRERDPCGNHIALHDSVLEVIRPNVCCGASYKDQPGFQVHLIQLAISWNLCGTGNMTLLIFGKHNLSQWTKEVDSTPKLIYKHTLILSWTWPSFYRPYIPVYSDCIGIRSTDYLEKSRYFPLSWKISAICTEILICQYLPEDYHLFLFIYLFILAALGLILQPVGYSIFFAAHGIFNCGMWDLIPWAGIELESPALGAWCLNHWTTREALSFSFWNLSCSPHFPCSP